ncbi:hypothetical protein JCGZ_00079 [Jatropha curcas]|uniref:Uncharacterized protein n=1 Tax=Jatropha curcas TaxID=180498 RepID=A0A067JK11_JATCU|nr:hypothetical protein JCGZ_00079 [Jatropha curcas]
MDQTLVPAFEVLFHSFSHEDWDLLSPFKLYGLCYYRHILVQSGLLQWLINHFDPLGNLFRHNDFELCPLFEEFSIISGRISMVEEIPIVPRLDIDPASLILHVFDFSTYEMLSYDFGADVVPLRYQYLLLSGINSYGSLTLVHIVKQMARRHTPFPLVLAGTFTWLGEHARDSSSVLGSYLRGSQMNLPLVVYRACHSFLLLALCALMWVAMALAYYPSRIARQYSHHQAVPDYMWFKGGLLIEQFLSRFISTWPSRTTVLIFDVADTSSLNLYYTWL